MTVIYADYNATTPLAPTVAGAMTEFINSGNFYNPSAFYGETARARSAMEGARKQVADLIGAETGEVVFTSGASESNFAAVLGRARMASWSCRKILTTNVEHASLDSACKIAFDQGAAVVRIPVRPDGTVTAEDVLSRMDRNVFLVSIIHANNETGVVIPVGEIAAAVKDRFPGVTFHTDATQSVGKLDVDLRGRMAGIDLLSMSAHKVHGPKGIGVLFVREESCWEPIFPGKQENGRRAGTENILNMVGFAAAAEFVGAYRADYARVGALRDELQARLERDAKGLSVNGKGAERLPTTLSVSVDYLDAEELLYALDQEGICASSGSACSTGSLEPSHVVKAMGVREKAIRGTVRFSFGIGSHESDFDAIGEAFPRIVSDLRKLSPYVEE